MTFEQTIYWISPILLCFYVLSNYYIFEVKLNWLAKFPFPWCCSSTMNETECQTNLAGLKHHSTSIENLSILTHIAFISSLVNIVFLIFIVIYEINILFYHL